MQVGGVGMAGGPVQEEKGRPGEPVQNISDVGGGGGVLASLPGQERVTLESLHLHYTQETISPSTIFWITRCTFYFFSIE